MNKKEFAICLAGRIPYRKEEVEFILDIIAEVMKEGIENDGVVKTPFGTFKKTTRARRRIRSISTGDLHIIPSRSIITFKPSKELKGEE